MSIRPPAEDKAEHPFPHKLFIREGYIGVIHHPNDQSITIYTLGTKIVVGEFIIDKEMYSETYNLSDPKQPELAHKFKEFLAINNLPYFPNQSNGEVIDELTERAKSLLSLADKLNTHSEYEI